AVATGSRGLLLLLHNTGLTIFVLSALFVLFVFAVTRTTWRPVAPFRLGRRRTWGQILSAAGHMYVEKPVLFLSMGLLFIPLSVLVSFTQALIFGGFGLVGVHTTGESAGALVSLVVAIGTLLTLLGLTLVQAATAAALVDLDAGRRTGALSAYRSALKKF